MRRRQVAGRVLAGAYALLLAAFTLLFARWPQGPGWGPVTFTLLGLAGLSFAGTALPRRLGFMGLPLLFLGGVPAQAAAFLLVLLGPGLLYQPFTEALATRLTMGLGAMIFAWFAGFFLLVATPSPRPVAVTPESEGPDVALTVVEPPE